MIYLVIEGRLEGTALSVWDVCHKDVLGLFIYLSFLSRVDGLLIYLVIEGRLEGTAPSVWDVYHKDVPGLCIYLFIFLSRVDSVLIYLVIGGRLEETPLSHTTLRCFSVD